MRKMIVALIRNTYKKLTLFGAPKGSKWGSKGSKIARLLIWGKGEQLIVMWREVLSVDGLTNEYLMR